MNILVTGSEGFVGKNLQFFLKEKKFSYYLFNKRNKIKDLKILLNKSDTIIHLAGQNKGYKKGIFYKNNLEITQTLVKNLPKNKEKYIIYASSIKSSEKNVYGITKKKTEEYLLKNRHIYNYQLSILKLPNLFGKWCKPNYNSVIATFCNNIANGKKIILNNGKKKIKFLYIDDLTEQIFCLIKNKKKILFPVIKKTYIKSICYIAKKLKSFKEQNSLLNLNIFSNSFDKKLYSTFLTYLPTAEYSKKLKSSADKRGYFCELIKSNKYGQFSFFTIKKNENRGGHYHSSKVERFFPVSGDGYIRFRSILNNKKIDIKFSEKKFIMIETIPGWSHQIFNTGSKECIFICWANENFNSKKPDTHNYKV